MNAETIRQNQANAYQLSVDEVLTAFKTEAQHGLSKDEARARIEHYGKNELTAKKPVPEWKKFISQFQNPLVILLLAATLISAGLWLYERDSALPYEALAIFLVVLLNAVLGYVQQARSEQAVAGCFKCSTFLTPVRTNKARSLDYLRIIGCGVQSDCRLGYRRR